MSSKETVFLGVPNYRKVLASGFELLEQANLRLVENFNPSLESVVDFDLGLNEVSLIVSGLERWDSDAMDRCPQLRGIVKSGTGLDNIDLDAARARNILVANTPGLNANAVAELTVAYMIAAMRHFSAGRAAIQDGVAAVPVGQEVSHKTVGILGYGEIGRRVCQLLSGFDVDILVSDPAVNSDQDGVEVVELNELLMRSDVLTLHAPASRGTDKIINERSLALMKSSAVLVNTARGSLVDEDALLDALNSGRLFGAALDVFDREPPSPEHVLVDHPKVFSTNHMGAASVESDQKVARATAEAIIAISRGQDPMHRVV